MFKTGSIVATVGVASRSARDHEFGLHLLRCLARHVTGDWGDLCSEDQETNARALVEDLRLLSAYEHEQFPKLWIITEADRSSTCILFPDEY